MLWYACIFFDTHTRTYIHRCTSWMHKLYIFIKTKLPIMYLFERPNGLCTDFVVQLPLYPCCCYVLVFGLPESLRDVLPGKQLGDDVLKQPPKWERQLHLPRGPYPTKAQHTTRHRPLDRSPHSAFMERVEHKLTHQWATERVMMKSAPELVGKTWYRWSVWYSVTIDTHICSYMLMYYTTTRYLIPL